MDNQLFINIILKCFPDCNLDHYILSFAEDTELTKDGLRSAATWANTEMMEICAKKVTDSHQADTLLQTSDLHRIMKEAVMSDSDEAVKIVKTIYENRHLKTADVEDIVNMAAERKPDNL